MSIPHLSIYLRATGVVFCIAALGCTDSTPKVNVTTSPATSGSAAPRPVVFDPPNGAEGVDPARTTLAVTFDREMDPQGWAWVIESTRSAPALGDSIWDPATRTNSSQVKLEPGRDYVIWINSAQYLYFKDRLGLPAEPTRWSFSTAGTRANGSTPAAGEAAMPPTAPPPIPPPGAPPRVAALEPPNGATAVDPATTVLRATFDRPMGEGWSWVIEPGATFPEAAGAASMTADGLQALLPVKLAPATTYVIWLNSQQHQDFADRAGVALPPLRWTFTTRATR